MILFCYGYKNQMYCIYVRDACFNHKLIRHGHTINQMEKLAAVRSRHWLINSYSLKHMQLFHIWSVGLHTIWL